ncbi:hypothetical protein NSP_24280 [Nodularia spumigena CCY9414]|nr:hypothetical protein NSP_24280 [Nodularia spumigena CCY9414]
MGRRGTGAGGRGQGRKGKWAGGRDKCILFQIPPCSLLPAPLLLLGNGEVNGIYSLFFSSSKNSIFLASTNPKTYFQP